MEGHGFNPCPSVSGQTLGIYDFKSIVSNKSLPI